MNRVLAVRGKVVPASATPLKLRARTRDGTPSTGSRRSCAPPGIERVWIEPGRRRARPTDALRGDRRGRHRRARAGQPVHERPARAADPGDPRGGRATRRAPPLRLQRRDPGGRDRGLRPRRPRRGAARAHGSRSSSTSCSRTTGSTATDAPWPADAVRAVAGRRRSSPRRTSPRDGRRRASPTRTTTTRRAWPRPSCGRSSASGPRGVRERVARLGLTAPGDGRRRTGTSSRRSARSSRRIDPSRDVRSRGRSGRPRPRPGGATPTLARLAVRLARREPSTGAAGCRARAATRRLRPSTRPAPFDWPTRPEHCRMAWLRGRFLARGSLSLAAGRTHLEFVVAGRRRRRCSRRGSPSAGMPPSWRVRRGRGVVTWKSAETRRAVPAPDRRRARACWSSRRARWRGRCAATSTG